MGGDKTGIRDCSLAEPESSKLRSGDYQFSIGERKDCDIIPLELDGGTSAEVPDIACNKNVGVSCHCRFENITVVPDLIEEFASGGFVDMAGCGLSYFVFGCKRDVTASHNDIGPRRHRSLARVFFEHPRQFRGIGFAVAQPPLQDVFKIRDYRDRRDKLHRTGRAGAGSNGIDDTHRGCASMPPSSSDEIGNENVDVRREANYTLLYGRHKRTASASIASSESRRLFDSG